MHIPPFVLASIGFSGVIFGRFLFGHWFNHLSLYSLIWGMSLTLFELGWIAYTPLTVEAWILIGYAWIAFTAGSAIVLLARAAISASPGTLSGRVRHHEVDELEKRLLIVFIMILLAVALFGVLQHWSVLIKKFGSITGVLLNAATIYRLRVAEKFTGMIPYTDSMALTAACLAGRYSAKLGGIKPLALFPFVIILLEEIASASRTKLLVGVILFLTTYFLSKVGLKQRHAGRTSRGLGRVFMLPMIITILIVGIEFIRLSRAGTENLYGATRKFEKFSFLPPSVYLYMSAHPGVFSAYLKAEDERSLPGYNTFAPFFRILTRLGIVEKQPAYQKFYNIPIAVNTGTYLRELYADFGISGILLFPYLLGLICTMSWLRFKRQPQLLTTFWLSHLYVVVAFTYVLQATRWGFLLVSLGGSLLVGGFIDRKCNMKTATLQLQKR